MSESTVFLSQLLLVFLLAGVVKGVTGMGLPTVAMALLSLSMPPVAAAALLLVPSLLTNLWQLLAGPSIRDLLQRLWLMLLGIVVGTLASVTWLASADPQRAAMWLGLALLAYAIHGLLSPAVGLPARLEAWLSLPVGVLTGLVTGATGVLVMPVVAYLQMLSLDREQLIQALGLSFTVSTLALAAGLAMQDALLLSQLGWSAIAIVPALAGMWLGQRLRRRISPPLFRRGLLGMLGLMGVELLVRGW